MDLEFLTVPRREDADCLTVSGETSRPKSWNTPRETEMISIPKNSARMSSSASLIQQDQYDNPILVGSNQKLNTQLLDAVANQNMKEIVRLLREGANPNATCRLTRLSACHIAAFNGGEALPLLLRAGAKTDRFDSMGRTPLLLATWAGNTKEIAILLGFPEDLKTRVCDKKMSSEIEEEVKQFRPSLHKRTNALSDTEDINVLPTAWMDGIGHACRDLKEHLPILEPKWTPLHAASYFARAHCVWLLLTAGADPDIKDLKGHIPFEIVGCAVNVGHVIDNEEFVETIKLLVKAGSKNVDLEIRGVKTYSPLHTAVEVGGLEAIRLLLEARVSALPLNAEGLTPMHLCVKKKLKDHLQLLANHYYKNKSAIVDIKDNDGFTVLHTAVRSNWMPGVRIALYAGANLILTANNGQTALHEAAAYGYTDVLNKLLEVAQLNKIVDCPNFWGETALFAAVRGGHLECVKKLLKEGASIEHTLRGNISILHIAAHKGDLDILSFLIDSNYSIIQKLINSLARSCRYYYFSPLHIAVFHGHLECVKLLLSKNADAHLDSDNTFSTPLHIAAMKNNWQIANAILEFDKTTLNLVSDLGWEPLHTACYYGSRDCIRVLLQEGADMSTCTAKSKNETALSMIMNNISKPTEFMEEIFDSYIKNRNRSRVIDIDFSILTPNDGDAEQMTIIHALHDTGNRYDQRKLLLHPLIESFLYLKWKALLPFFYTILILYSLFTISLTILIMSVFAYKDNKEDAPVLMNTTFWSYTVYVAVSLVVILEIIYAVNIKNKTYCLHLETWVKFSSIILGIVLARALVLVQSDAEWIRHLSTVAVLASWLEMMFLLSRFPEWGYYFLMFGTVASKVLKILVIFMFLLIGFSLGFMIQFHSVKPFDNFWSAVVKTMVMMTSEFDYNDLFKDKYSKEFATIILQLIFLVFIIMTAIVLMNLMVGVAVNDVHDLELIGNINRIEKRIDLLGSLESLVYSDIFNKFLPRCVIIFLQTRRRVRKHNRIQLGEGVLYNSNILPSHITDRIFDKALSIEKRVEDQDNSDKFKTQIYEMTGQELSSTDFLDEMDKNTEMFHEDKQPEKQKKQSYVSFLNDDYRYQMNTKIEKIAKEIDEMKHSLLRIEKYLDEKENNFA